MSYSNAPVMYTTTTAAVPVPIASAPPAPASSAPEPSAPPFDIEEFHRQRLAHIAALFEIRPDWLSFLRALYNYNIYMVIDDSGSMGSVVDAGKDPYAPVRSRWDELKETVRIVAEIATIFDRDGIDLYFLNRPDVHNVSCYEQIQENFRAPPCGYTPLADTLKRIFREKDMDIREKPTMVIIATDGAPTDTRGNPDIDNFTKVLMSKHKNVVVSVLACTDDESAVGYLNKLDVMVPNMDVVDDFRSERKEVLSAQGKNFHFTFGDYVVKALLGPINPYFDSLDEKKRASWWCMW